MVAVLDIRNESQHLYILSMVFCLALFQVPLTNCLDHGVFRRVIRSFPRPDNLMVAPVQIHDPTFEPTVPFLGELSEKLTIGKVVRIHGYVPADARRFDVNLCTDCYEGPMQFHISIRFNPKDIVRNTFQGDRGWGYEDRTGSRGLFPLALEREFDMVIEVKQDTFNISIDGQRHVSWTFPHRMPFTDVDKIEITGSVLIWKIEYTDILHEELNDVISTSGSSDASERNQYQLNGDTNSALTIDITNPSHVIDRFSMDLRCECVPQSSPPQEEKVEKTKKAQ